MKASQDRGTGSKASGQRPADICTGGELPPAKIAEYSGLDLKTVTELSQNVS